MHSAHNIFLVCGYKALSQKGYSVFGTCVILTSTVAFSYYLPGIIWDHNIVLLLNDFIPSEGV